MAPHCNVPIMLQVKMTVGKSIYALEAVGK